MPTVHEKGKWYSRVNVALPAGGHKDRARTAAFEFKQFLRGLHAGAEPDFPAWTVVGSSDGVTAGMDGVDRITDPTKIVSPTVAAGSAGPRSWIVLTRNGLYLRIAGGASAISNEARGADFVMSKTAPTGGLATGANETAVFPVMTNAFGPGGGGLSYNASIGPPDNLTLAAMRFHMAVAADGSFTYCANEAGRGFFTTVGFFNVFTDARPTDTHPYIFLHSSANSATVRSLALNFTSNFPQGLSGDGSTYGGRFMRSVTGAGDGCDLAALFGRMGVSSSGHRSVSAWLTANDASDPVGSRPDWHLWVCSNNSLRGRLQDVRLAPENMVDGTTDSATDPKSFTAGCLWLPIAGAPDMS